MIPESLTPQNTTIVLIDFAIGFGNVFRSHALDLNVNNALTLADTALTYRSGLVVTNGIPAKTSGPYYTQLGKLLGEIPIVVRGGMFNAFLFEPFKEAVHRSGRKNLVVAGLVTEGCVLQTVLGGLREGYRVHVAVDACAGATRETHDTAVQRMVQAGATPLTAFSLASEFQVDQDRPDAKSFFGLTERYQPEMTFLAEYFQWSQSEAKKQLGN